MCGIAAIWDWGGRGTRFPSLAAMARAQVDRGPDGHGYAVWGPNRRAGEPAVWLGPNSSAAKVATEDIRVGLAHNWLAIQDTGSGARQPMTIEPQRYWIVFNGEIYNFVELREALVGDGFHFRSSSDTEVLLALWQQQGRGALRR